MTLTAIADAVEVAPPTAHRHLNDLLRDGVVEVSRARGGAGITYQAAPSLRARWIDPRRGLFIEWVAHAEVDWRYPLVTRVPDAPARRFLLEFLRASERRGLFTPWLMPRDELEGPGGEEWALLREPANHEGVTIAVYGSCARGEARPASDVDVLVIVPSRQGRAPVNLGPFFEEIADDLALRAEREIDLRVVHRGELDDALPRALRDAILRDAITVFTSVPRGEFLEGGT